MGEFVDGYDSLLKIGPCISVYGSARLKPGSKYYEEAVKVSELIVENGFGVITGGGPGIMEAGNKGAYNRGGKSVGLGDRKSTRLNSSHVAISYAVVCLKNKDDEASRRW